MASEQTKTRIMEIRGSVAFSAWPIYTPLIFYLVSHFIGPIESCLVPPHKQNPHHPVINFSYVPFGAGPRQCIGNNFDLMEAGLVMACVLQRFELHSIPGMDVQFVLRPNRDVMMSLHA